MTVQKFHTAAHAPIAPASPNALLVSALSDIVAPITNTAASALISLAARLSKRQSDKPVKPTAPQMPHLVPHLAPHVAMVMVPGKFVTEPFTHR
ncbi:MAG: hypothetical protein HN478_23085 [Rhodospirillaceae bacterium]|jgi:hypothetical protein|nr:hypothetical protein [Rhodospirillaceae bacterium]MBT4486103.1 hypothetical protein [Rhodospirillaceae bacterium]MBT5194691.1 hypothetical protein [Rhodospirillaceae bacterium]MBT6428651.1 hypothetical protein [Rhodospirillaceae bacterium]MBT7755933.1 hypothetical protein [Rhodospirillaceae bacterium]